MVFLFVLGAVASLIGDHSHVVTGTTEYLTARGARNQAPDAVPFVWSSPIWFPVMVGAATVSLAELRLHLPDPRTSVTARQGLAGVAAVIGTYVTTALVHSAPTVPGTRWGIPSRRGRGAYDATIHADSPGGAWPAPAGWRPTVSRMCVRLARSRAAPGVTHR
jgi:hypothetical protein